MGRILLMVGCLSGCASEGPLHPPSLKLPAAVTAVTAVRTGDAVELQWKTPTKTTDGVPLAGKHSIAPLTAEVCRDTAPLPAMSAPCNPIARVPVQSGAAGAFHDVLPRDLTQGELRVLRYRLRVLNGFGRGAGYTAVESLAGAAPAPVQGFRVSAATAGGADLRWQKLPAAGERVRMRVVRGPLPQGQSGQSRNEPGDLLMLEGVDSDPGGAADSAARAGVEQHYTIYRERTVTVDGQALTVRSETATATLAADAAAPPPEPPTGLEAVANTLGSPEIDLVWQPSAGAAAYVVFRAEGNGQPVRITAQPVRGFSYADAAVRRGVRYRYSVAAVGAQGAAGAPGAEVTEQIPEP